jgi:hypothetical protein
MTSFVPEKALEHALADYRFVGKLITPVTVVGLRRAFVTSSLLPAWLPPCARPRISSVLDIPSSAAYPCHVKDA